MTLWMFIVYFPLAHMIWGIDGMMNGVSNADAKINAIDFAGGTVVHMTSGWSALILCLILGKRLGWGKNQSPRTAWCSAWSAPACCGSAGTASMPAAPSRADVIAANAFTTTTLATAVASFVWPMTGMDRPGQAQRAGLLLRRGRRPGRHHPACGFVTASGAVLIGIAAGLIPWFFCYKVKNWFGYDDALDTFGVHAVGGTLGAFLTGVLARNAANANLANNLKAYVTDSLFQPLVFGATQSHRPDAASGHRRHNRDRLRRQIRRRPAPD